jgi:deoxyadenosine/deoxycytidine kinase/nucleoside 2-deoxyribosyltransferase
MRGEARPRAYYASGFNHGERSYSLEVKQVLDDLGYDTWLPNENAELFDGHVAAGMPIDEARRQLFKLNLRAVEEADVVVFNLDGGMPDEGACVEAGIAYGQGKLCVGLKTNHHGPDGRNNLMIDGILDHKVANNLDELRDLVTDGRVIVDLRRGAEDVTIDLRRLEHSYVVVSGSVGVGKTSLIDLMARTGTWVALPEPVMENPYLSKVYANLPDYAFRNQAFYLGQRALLHNSAKSMPGAVVQERCLSEDAEVFNYVMHEQGAIDDNDLETLMTLYRGLFENTPRPDLVLYLTAPFEVAVERIRNRDRLGEGDLDVDFLCRVHDRYEDWASSPKSVPVLRIDTTETDYVNSPEDAAEVMRRIDGFLTDVLVYPG